MKKINKEINDWRDKENDIKKKENSEKKNNTYKSSWFLWFVQDYTSIFESQISKSDYNKIGEQIKNVSADFDKIWVDICRIIMQSDNILPDDIINYIYDFRDNA